MTVSAVHTEQLELELVTATGVERVPDWPMVQRYSAIWYRLAERWQLVLHPGLDAVSRANLRQLVRIAEAREAR